MTTKHKDRPLLVYDLDRENPGSGSMTTKLTDRPLSYLAVPFSHRNHTVKWNRFVACTKVAARMTESGITVFSPITHSAPMELLAGVKGTWDMWRVHDFRYIGCCKEMFVLCLPGWESSLGVTAEREHATELGMPVYYVLLDDAMRNVFWEARPWETFCGERDYTTAPIGPYVNPEVFSFDL